MSRWTENECVGCPPNMGCLGAGCPNRNVLHIECDECGEEVMGEEEIYEFDGKDYCIECAKKLYPEEFDEEGEEE